MSMICISQQINPLITCVGNTQNLIRITPKYTQYKDKTKMYARMANIAGSGTRVPVCGIQVLKIHKMGLKE